jgi:hypothetical protein
MNTLIVGPPGSGKSTAACTGNPPCGLVDVDGKALEMVNLRPLIDKGDVVIIPIKSKMMEDRLADRALNPDKGIKTQPKGYLEVVDILNDIIDGEAQYDPFNTIILDSITRTIEHMKRLLIHLRGKGKFGKMSANKADDMNWPSWGSYLSNLEELFNGMTTFLEGKDFVCCAHLKTLVEKDPITEVEIIKGYWPMVDGQMREKIAGYFNEVYYMDVVEKRGIDPEYRFRTRGKKYCARTSMDLEEFVPANLMEIRNE